MQLLRFAVVAIVAFLAVSCSNEDNSILGTSSPAPQTGIRGSDRPTATREYAIGFYYGPVLPRQLTTPWTAIQEFRTNLQVRIIDSDAQEDVTSWSRFTISIYMSPMVNASTSTPPTTWYTIAEEPTSVCSEVAHKGLRWPDADYRLNGQCRWFRAVVYDYSNVAATLYLKANWILDDPELPAFRVCEDVGQGVTSLADLEYYWE
jgi:hypothetical protein